MMSKMSKIKFLIAGFVLLVTAPTFAQMSVTQSGTEFEIKYTEPTQNAVNPDTGEAPPLTDLAFTTIFFQKDFDAQPTKIVDVAATSPSGGGKITQLITVPITPFSEYNLDFLTTATDDAVPLANESEESVRVQERIDNWAPAPPG